MTIDHPARQMSRASLPVSALRSGPSVRPPSGSRRARRRFVPCSQITFLANRFPVLRHTLGQRRFDAMAGAYLAFRKHIATRAQAEDLVDWLDREETPDWIGSADAGSTLRALLLDLARLERAIHTVAEADHLDSDRMRLLTSGELGALGSAALQHERLRIVPSLMLRRSGFALARYVREVQEALVLGRVTSPALPAARAETIVLHRRGGKVSSLVLDEPREQLLEDLLAGAPVGRALERAFSRGASTGLDLGSSFAASTPAAWIEHWTSQGLFLHPGKRRW